MPQFTGLKLGSVTTHKGQKVFPISCSFACFINKRSFDVKVNGSHSFREGFYGSPSSDSHSLSLSKSAERLPTITDETRPTGSAKDLPEQVNINLFEKQNEGAISKSYCCEKFIVL